jgi:hypothetical protein
MNKTPRLACCALTLLALGLAPARAQNPYYESGPAGTPPMMMYQTGPSAPYPYNQQAEPPTHGYDPGSFRYGLPTRQRTWSNQYDDRDN